MSLGICNKHITVKTVIKKEPETDIVSLFILSSSLFLLPAIHSSSLDVVSSSSVVRGPADDPGHRPGGGADRGRVPARPVPQDLHPQI